VLNMLEMWSPDKPSGARYSPEVAKLEHVKTSFLTGIICPSVSTFPFLPVCTKRCLCPSDTIVDFCNEILQKGGWELQAKFLTVHFTFAKAPPC